MGDGLSVESSAFDSMRLGDPPGRRRRPGLALAARLRRRGLDRALAAGADPSESNLLRYRAAQLTTPRRRRSLADSLDGLVAAAERRPERMPSAAVPLRRGEVRAARPQIAALEERLRSDEPVWAQGVAMLMCMLTDAASPIFVGSAGSLGAELDDVLTALDGREPGW